SDGWISVKPARGKRHRRDLLTILARLPANTSKDANALSEASTELQETGTTMVMFGGSGAAHGRPSGSAMTTNTITINPDTPLAQRWFRFGPDVNFEQCVPVDQEKMKVEA